MSGSPTRMHDDEPPTPEELSRLFASGPLPCNQWRLQRSPNTQRSSSPVHILECAGTGKRFAAKVYRSGEITGVEQARKEVESLSLVARRMNDDEGYGVARGFDFLVERGCVVTEWIDGISLSSILNDGRRRDLDVIDFAARSGVWLRRFHDAYPAPPRPLAVDRMLERIECLARDASGAHFLQRNLVAALAVLHDSAAVVARIDAPCSWLHGDFKPGNLIFADDGRRVAGIDLSLDPPGPSIRCVAKFIVEVELSAARPFSWHLRRRNDAIIRAFLAGYRHSHALDPVLHWSILHRLAWMWSTRYSLRGACKHAFDLYCISRLLVDRSRRVAASVVV